MIDNGNNLKPAFTCSDNEKAYRILRKLIYKTECESLRLPNLSKTVQRQALLNIGMWSFIFLVLFLLSFTFCSSSTLKTNCDQYSPPPKTKPFFSKNLQYKVSNTSVVLTKIWLSSFYGSLPKLIWLFDANFEKWQSWLQYDKWKNKKGLFMMNWREICENYSLSASKSKKKTKIVL